VRPRSDSLDDLDSLWSDHLINLRELRLGYLSHNEVEHLLTSLIPKPPKDSLAHWQQASTT